MLPESYLFLSKLNTPIKRAVKEVKESLQKSGFRIVSELNFSDFIKDCLGIRLDKKYIILEVCHPFIAYKSLLTTLDTGLFLPIRIVIYEDESGDTVISALNPEQVAGLIQNEVFKLVVKEASEKLKYTISSL